MNTIKEIQNIWENTEEKNSLIYKDFLNNINNIDYLLNHRKWVVQNNHGYGEDPFHYMWYLLCKDLNENFKKVNFIEIGVYMGQILSLIPLICSKENISNTYLGVTPLDDSGDKCSTYTQKNYISDITRIFNHHNLLFSPSNNIIKGSSIYKNIINQFTKNTYNLAYIDGCHDYDYVKQDFENIHSCLEVNGYVVFDDASLNLHMPSYITFKGHKEVSDVVDNIVKNHPSYIEILACGHNRVFKKIKA